MKDAEACPFCEVPSEQIDVQKPAVDGGLDLSEPGEPEWRQEVGRRLNQYRARRGRVRGEEEAQSGLPFQKARSHSEEAEIPVRSLSRLAPRSRSSERMEIWIQPELDFSASPDDRARPQTATVPVATLAERRDAGLLDALFVLMTFAAFAGLFRSLGGEIMIDKIDAVICGAVLYLFYGLYLLIFTVFAGSTPGMQIRGLNVVRLDGSLPDTRQLLWRGFGYLLSGATLMLGFLWAIWDEDRLTWHDRISQTYVTAATPAPQAGPIEIRPRRSLAHR